MSGRGASAMRTVKAYIADRISAAIDGDINPSDIEKPNSEEHGDFAYPAMQAAAIHEMDPRSLATEIREGLMDNAFFLDVSVAGPGFVNITVDRTMLMERLAEQLQEDGKGVSQQEERVLVEFSSPNVAKPMHVGHLRNTILGDVLQRMLRYCGYDVVSENYLGDWGTQYGKLVYAFLEYGDEERFEAEPMEHMFDLYVRFHEEMDDDPELAEKGREWAKRIEEGDEEAVSLWERFRDASLEYHKQDYSQLDVSFDRITGESAVVEETNRLLEEGVDNSVISNDADGSLSIDFDELPSTVLRKADGTTLYLSRDLATLEKRKEEGFDEVLYVVGSEQELHFRQLFAAASRLGIDTGGCEHISYGLLELDEGQMSSREGEIIRLSSVVDRAMEKAAERMDGRDEKIAQKIGLGAIRFANCSVSRQKDVSFDWESVLAFEGRTGPYIQYSRTRATSILDETDEEPVVEGEPSDEAFSLMKKLLEFPEAVEGAVEKRDPVEVADFAFKVCELFNTFYHSCPVLQADEMTRKRRLAVVSMFVDVIEDCMMLLGVPAVERM